MEKNTYGKKNYAQHITKREKLNQFKNQCRNTQTEVTNYTYMQ